MIENSITTLQQSNPDFWGFLLTVAASAVVDTNKTSGSNTTKHLLAKSAIENILNKFYDDQDKRHNFPDYIDWAAKEFVIPLIDDLIILSVKNMKALDWGKLL